MTITNKNEFIGSRIKEYRKKNNWTQQDLAERTAMKKNTISIYELGRVEVPRSKLSIIAQKLDVKMTDLLPAEETVSQDSIDEHIRQAKAKLTSDQLSFLELLIAKTYTLPPEERQNFLKNVKFATEFFDKE